MYRLECANCHGTDAKGFQGPDLMAAIAASDDDDPMFRTIRSGVPGTEMPAHRGPDDDIWKILAYLRTLDVHAAAEPAVSGNSANGARLFDAHCMSCHRLNGAGGTFGPDLSRIGSARPRAALVREIRTPSEVIVRGYEGVTLVTMDGRRVTGVRKNEDLFSIQIMERNGRLQGYDKAELQEVIVHNESLMPAFASGQLNETDLRDLVSFLLSLRSSETSTGR